MQSLPDSQRVLLRGGVNGGIVLVMHHAARSRDVA
jgi:hypothetical protein